jgi:cytochrome P460
VRKIIVAVICLVLFLSAAITLRSAFLKQASTFVPVEPQVAGEKLIAGYRQWTRVNPQPQMVPALVSRLCIAPRITPAGPGSPHGPNKYITVYVNDIGRHAMMEEKTPLFPQGSIVVKEKLTTPTSTTPELLTVMLKREPGFNPESGDWEYMVIDGMGKTVQARGKLENCQSCHLLEKDTDYISRTYLPRDVKLK